MHHYIAHLLDGAQRGSRNSRRFEALVLAAAPCLNHSAEWRASNDRKRLSARDPVDTESAVRNRYNFSPGSEPGDSGRILPANKRALCLCDGLAIRIYQAACKCREGAFLKV